MSKLPKNLLDFPYCLLGKITVEEEILCNKEKNEFSVVENLYFQPSWVYKFLHKLGFFE